jgi:glycerophosphoryl diester phosphodiesterase
MLNLHMTKKHIIAVSMVFLVFTGKAQQHPDQKLAAIFNPANKKVLVAAHRGDWRHTPENSMMSLTNSIEKGFDIMELDVKMSKDSVLVIMHDNTIDRSTNAKGKPGDYTLAELKNLRLRNGLGRVTTHQIPTLEEMLLVARGKVIINVDKGNNYLPQVIKLLKKTGTTGQTIVNVNENMSYPELQKSLHLPDDVYVMVVVAMKRPDALSIIESYKIRKRSIIQPIFDTDTLSSIKALPKLSEKQVLWINSLWPSLNGGHDDDRAVEQGEEEQSWGWLLKLHPAILQTDRPAELQTYLKKHKK